MPYVCISVKDATNFEARVDLRRRFGVTSTNMGSIVGSSTISNLLRTLDLYEDALEVTEAEPLAAYAFSGRLGSRLTVEMRESFINLIRQELAARGTLHITAASGLFEAQRT